MAQRICDELRRVAVDPVKADAVDDAGCPRSGRRPPSAATSGQELQERGSGTPACQQQQRPREMRNERGLFGGFRHHRISGGERGG